MIMAAGLGTRLKPWTEHHPKALVPVCGVPVLDWLISKLKNEGFDRIVVNVHHFADQVREHLSAHDYDVRIDISDETDELLDTGGALVKAAPIFLADGGPVLVHNVDILSNQDLCGLVQKHEQVGNDITLLTSGRESSRKLIFDSDGELKGWHNNVTDEYRPAGFMSDRNMTEEAFSGIYVLGADAVKSLADYSHRSCRANGVSRGSRRGGNLQSGLFCSEFPSKQRKSASYIAVKCGYLAEKEGFEPSRHFRALLP